MCIRSLLVMVALAAGFTHGAWAAGRSGSGGSENVARLGGPSSDIAQAMDALSGDRPQDALKYLDRIIAAEPSFEMAREARVEAYARLRRYGDAQKEALEILQKNPGNLYARRVLAAILIRARDGANAELLLGPAIEKDKLSADYLSRARARALQGNLEQALEDTASAIKADKGSTSAYQLRAYLLKLAQRQSEVPALAQQLRRQTVGTDQGYFYASGLLQLVGEIPLALEMLDEGIRVRPGPDILLNRARLRGNTEAAVADVRSAVKRQPDSDSTLLGAVHALIFIQRYPEALELSKQLEQKKAAAYAGLNARGISQWQLGNHEAAVASFAAARSQAAKAEEFNSMCWSKATYGVALEEALLDCNAALERKADASETLDSKGFVLLRLGRLAESVQTYDEAIRLSPRAFSFYGRGIARKRMGDAEAGIKDMELGLLLDPFAGFAFNEAGVTP